MLPKQLTIKGCLKTKVFKHPLFQGIGEIFQNGQTEPSEAWVTRRCMCIHREAKFVRSKKT